MNRTFVTALALLLSALGTAGVNAAETVTFHPASAMLHVGGADGNLPPAAEKYALEMARGEREGFQLAVCAAHAKAVRISAVALVEKSPNAPKAALYRVLAVNHTAPIKNMFEVPPRNLGLIPDVLLPLAGRSQTADTLPAEAQGVPLTYYAEFASSQATQAGSYVFEVQLAGGEGAEAWRASFPVEVHVRNVVLPKRLPFRSATDWHWSLAGKDGYFGRALETAEKQKFWRFCLDYRLSPCVFFGKQPDPAPAEAAELADEGLSVVCLMQVGGRKPRLIGDAEKQKLEPELKQWREELKKLKLESDAVVLLTDEPQAGSEGICRQNAAWLKSQYPELKMWCATRPVAPWDEFVDVVDVVTAHSTDIYRAHSHDEAAAEAFRRAHPRGEYWWFHSVEPYAPYTNVRLDNPPIEGRVAGWQSAQARVDGYEYFWITDWALNKETKNVPWPDRAAQWQTGQSGAGTLCYPDEQGLPMPSLRLVNLRDGLEDWALLEALSPRKDRKGGIPGIEAVTHGLADFTHSPEELLKARSAVLEKLSRK